MHICNLPPEVVEMVYEELAFDSLALLAFSQTCRQISALVHQAADNHLWRRIFLRMFDDPRASNHLALHPFKEHEWRREYTRRARAILHLSRGFKLGSKDSAWFSKLNLSAICACFKTALPIVNISPPAGNDPDALLQPQELIHFLDIHRSSPLTPPNLSRSGDLRSKNVQYCEDLITETVLHALYGKMVHLSIKSYQLLAYIGWFRDSYETLKERMLSWARPRVFDMTYLRQERMFGPFLLDMGTHEEDPSRYKPDWAHLAAVRFVTEDIARKNPMLFPSMCDLNALRPGTWSPGIPHPLRPKGTAAHRDWAGVAGIWRRLVVWVGYGNLLKYNEDGLREHSFVELGQTHVIIPLRFKIISFEDNPNTAPGFPTIHFEGESGGEAWRADSDHVFTLDMRFTQGDVSMLRDGNILWRMTSYADETDEEEQWASQGIQIGGIGSAAGVLGMWTGAQHDPLDPIGAWWQWRVA